MKQFVHGFTICLLSGAMLMGCQRDCCRVRVVVAENCFESYRYLLSETNGVLRPDDNWECELALPHLMFSVVLANDSDSTIVVPTGNAKGDRRPFGIESCGPDGQTREIPDSFVHWFHGSETKAPGGKITIPPGQTLLCPIKLTVSDTSEMESYFRALGWETFWFEIERLVEEGQGVPPVLIRVSARLIGGSGREIACTSDWIPMWMDGSSSDCLLLYSGGERTAIQSNCEDIIAYLSPSSVPSSKFLYASPAQHNSLPPSETTYLPIDCFVVVENRGDSRWYYMDELSSFGYYNSSIEMPANDSIVRIGRVNRTFPRNLPDMTLIPPGGAIAIPFAFDNRLWDIPSDVALEKDVTFAICFTNAFIHIDDANHIQTLPSLVVRKEHQKIGPPRE